MTGREQLKAWIRRSKLTQVAAAAELGVAPPILSQWLHGVRTPNLTKAFELEEKTGVPARSWMLSDVSKTTSRGDRKGENAHD